MVKAWRVPARIPSKDKHAFIKRLIKVLVASWYIAAAAATTDLSKSHNALTKVSPRIYYNA